MFSKSLSYCTKQNPMWSEVIKDFLCFDLNMAFSGDWYFYIIMLFFYKKLLTLASTAKVYHDWQERSKEACFFFFINKKLHVCDSRKINQLSCEFYVEFLSKIRYHTHPFALCAMFQKSYWVAILFWYSDLLVWVQVCQPFLSST